MLIVNHVYWTNSKISENRDSQKYYHFFNFFFFWQRENDSVTSTVNKGNILFDVTLNTWTIRKTSTKICGIKKRINIVSVYITTPDT